MLLLLSKFAINDMSKEYALYTDLSATLQKVLWLIMKLRAVQILGGGGEGAGPGP